VHGVLGLINPFGIESRLDGAIGDRHARRGAMLPKTPCASDI
jgi:hypothetical protein